MPLALPIVRAVLCAYALGDEPPLDPYRPVPTK
jgi:hypothetical protein